MKKTKYIFVVGGVMSGVGKGVTSSSIGKIIQARGFNVTALKIDPYINVDAGTMNPTEHGEVFVLDDGDETDQDMGNYERFLNVDLSSDHYMSTGRVYQSVIQRERNLEYKGRCVEVVPHIPEEVINRIKKATKKSKAEVAMIEIGGTIGEYQNILFLEAARMLKIKYPDDVIFVLVSFLPIPSKVGEMKTKPTQYAARSLNTTGIQADFIVARSERPLDDKRKEKIAIFCNVSKKDVISAPDVESIYDVPINFEKDRLSSLILQKLQLKPRGKDMRDWKTFVKKSKNAKKNVEIGIIGKYFKTGDFVLSDAYISVIEAIKHATYNLGVKPIISWINSDQFEKNPEDVKDLEHFQGIIIPGGFGQRGVEGKILAAKYVRENKKPFLGLCLGMQIATIEFARHVLKTKQVSSTEFEPRAEHPVIHIMPDQVKKMEMKDYGGTMRLGAYPCVLDPESKSFQVYQEKRISERHRHRFEFNNKYRQILTKNGLLLAGLSPDKKLVEIIELVDHPWYVGVQFHPEFKSRPLKPHPLFTGFVKACLENK